MVFVTNTEIIEKLKKKYFSNTEILDAKNALATLPVCIEKMELDYKKLMGVSKKQLVADLIIDMMQKSGADEVEVEIVRSVLPTLIDGIVSLANKASKVFFKKTKRCCK